MPAGNPVDEIQKEFAKAKSQEDLAKLIGEEVASIFKADPNSPFEKMRTESRLRGAGGDSGTQFAEEDAGEVTEAHGSIQEQLEQIRNQIENLPRAVRDELERG